MCSGLLECWCGSWWRAELLRIQISTSPKRETIWPVDADFESQSTAQTTCMQQFVFLTRVLWPFVVFASWSECWCSVWAGEHCRISPTCFLAKCHKRRVGSFVLHCLLFLGCLCIACIFNFFSVLYFQCESLWMALYSLTADVLLRIYLLTQSLSADKMLNITTF